MPRHDEPTPIRKLPADTMALVQTKPHLAVLAVSSDRVALLREMGILYHQVRGQKHAAPHAWHIQRGVMTLG